MTRGLRWVEEWTARLIDTEFEPGQMTDVRMGRLLGRDPTVVATAREVLGLPSAPDRREAEIARRLRREDRDQPLTDAELGEYIGKRANTARRIRVRLGFAPYTDRRRGIRRTA